MNTERIRARWIKLCALANDPRTPEHEASLARERARRIYVKLCRVYSHGAFRDPAMFHISYPTWRKIHAPAT